MKNYNNLLMVTLLIVSLLGLYLVYSEDTNKYLQSLGYVLIGIGALLLTYYKKQQSRGNY